MTAPMLQGTSGNWIERRMTMTNIQLRLAAYGRMYPISRVISRNSSGRLSGSRSSSFRGAVIESFSMARREGGTGVSPVLGGGEAPRTSRTVGKAALEAGASARGMMHFYNRQPSGARAVRQRTATGRKQMDQDRQVAMVNPPADS